MEYRFDEWGMLKHMSAEELKAADADSFIIVLDRGVTPDNEPYWLYIAVKPSKYKEFMRIAKSGKSKVFSDYGKILKFGYDENVPATVKEEMKRKYGCDENTQANVQKKVSEARAAFLKEREERDKKRISDIVAMMTNGKQ